MAEDGEDWNGMEMTILKSLANFFKYTNDDVAPLNESVLKQQICVHVLTHKYSSFKPSSTPLILLIM